MELNQVSYFINLAETLNFTAAAKLSGVSQPSLTRSIRRLEEELGGPLIHRDGKNSRLTALGQDIETEFRSVRASLGNVRQHARNWMQGKQLVLDIAIAPSIGPAAFTSFFLGVLEQFPNVGIKIHVLRPGEDTAELLSGKYHACIVPRKPTPDLKLEVHPLFRERFVLGCAVDHPLSVAKVVRADDLGKFTYVDRLGCEYRTQIRGHFAHLEAVARPRFRSEREDWAQGLVAAGHAICILPERSVVVPDMVTRSIDGLDLARDVVIATVSGSTSPLEIRQIAQLASRHDWQ